MTDVRSATADLLEDRPDLADDLQALLEVDENGPWEFDDIPLDSGSFGELVAADIVEQTDGQYRLRDPEAVRAILDGDTEKNSRSETEEMSASAIDLSTVRIRLANVDRVLLGALVGTLAFVVVMRTVFSWNAVFRDQIVLLGNDPYLYRFWLDQLVQTDSTLGAMPGSGQRGEALMVATLWGVATLFGNSTAAVGQVLSWYPVVAAVFGGMLIYKTAVVAFDDPRVGLASVAIYAVTPIVAYRSALGYSDHHAFDYLLLTLTVFGVVSLASEDSDWRTVTRRRLSGTAALSLGIAGQMHAWYGGALLVLPLAFYIAARVPTDVRANRSPLAANAWFLGSLAVSALLTAVPYVLVGWSGIARTVVPALLWGGALTVVGIGMLAHRFDIGTRQFLAAQVGSGVLIAATVWFGLPEMRGTVISGVNFFVRLRGTAIVETYSLFSSEFGVIMTPLLYLGFSFVFGMAALAGATYYVWSKGRPAWLVLVAYGWVFFVLSVIQLRFAGPFGIVLAVFGGVGFVYLLAAVGLLSAPRLTATEGETGRAHFRGETVKTPSLSIPDGKAAVMILALFLLVGGFGGLETASGTQDLVVEDTTFEAVNGMDEHAAATNTTWPENYVFSEWGANRMYNYHVNGQSRSYWYAQQNYESFRTSTEPDQWYERLAGKPTGYVVVEPTGEATTVPPEMIQSRLWKNWGSATADAAGVAHYRAVYANEERKVYELVPGATVVGHGTPGETQTVRTTFDVGGESRTYERRVTATANGWYAVRVPYNGTYTLGSGQVSVSEGAVRSGSFASPVGNRAYWPLNASSGDVAFDVRGGHHGRIQGATWTESGLSFDGDDTVRVSGKQTFAPTGNFTLSVSFRTQEGVNYVDDVQFPRITGTAPDSRFRNTSGFQIALSKGQLVGGVGNGEQAGVVTGPRVDDGAWHTATLVREGTTVRLYLDGNLVGETRYEGSVPRRDSFTIGSLPDGRGFTGDIRNVSAKPSA